MGVGLGHDLTRLGMKATRRAMATENTPNSVNDLLAAMSDGELDLRDNPDALAKIAQDPQAAQRIACQQQLRQACAKAMNRPEMKCPDALAAKLRAMGVEDTAAPAPTPSPAPASTAEYRGPAVVGRIGGINRWLPTAVAAVLLIAATVIYTSSNPSGGGIDGQQAAFLAVDEIVPASKLEHFSGRHGDCSLDTSMLKQSKQFGDATEFNQLPGKLADYFQTSTNGMRLSLDGIGYKYELTGACALPGKGAVHVVYRHKDNPGKAISLWVMPAQEQHQGLEEGQVYSKASDNNVMYPVIYWRQGSLLYYLVGDSIEDANKAVQELRQTA